MSLKIQIESTDQLTDFAGVAVRVWNGVTEDGVECILLVHRVCVRDDKDAKRLDAELIEMGPPRRVPLSDVLI